MDKNELTTSLTDQRQCDQEAIHLFASIQDHGMLLAFTWPDQRIVLHSENVDRYIQMPKKELLGSRLEFIFKKSFIQNLAKQIEMFPWTSPGQHLENKVEIQDKIFDVYLFHSQGLFVIELEESMSLTKGQQDDVKVEQTTKEYMLLSKQCKSLRELSQLVCSTYRKITGLDRVMMYRFLEPSWHGEVIAEDRVTHAHSYMGHRFPSSDIPRPARDLYLKNQVRLIPNVNTGSIPLSSPNNPLTKKTLDLSDSRLRSVAPIHLEYLKNMRVQASFSVAVTDQDQLWGLITCHHLEPIYISQSKRTACEIVAHAFSMQAPLIEKLSVQNQRLDFETKIKKVLEGLKSSYDPLDHFFKQHRTLTEAFEATGMALVDKSLTDFAGLTPLRQDIEDLANWARQKMNETNQSVLAIDNLSAQDEKWIYLKEYAAGILAVKLHAMDDSIFMLFRPEIIKTVTWGGDPRKQLDSRNFQGQINPRASFEAWEEIIKEKSKPWNPFEIDGISFLKDFVFEGFIKKEQLIKELGSRRLN